MKAPRLVSRIEQRTYGVEDELALDVLKEAMARRGWTFVEASRCPDDCECGEGPYWGTFAVDLATSNKEIN